MSTTASDNLQPNLVDMASVLARIQALESTNSHLTAEMQHKDARIEKLTESKRAEMQQMFQTSMETFLAGLEPKVSTVKIVLDVR